MSKSLLVELLVAVVVCGLVTVSPINFSVAQTSTNVSGIINSHYVDKSKQPLHPNRTRSCKRWSYFNN